MLTTFIPLFHQITAESGSGIVKIGDSELSPVFARDMAARCLLAAEVAEGRSTRMQDFRRNLDDQWAVTDRQAGSKICTFRCRGMEGRGRLRRVEAATSGGKPRMAAELRIGDFSVAPLRYDRDSNTWRGFIHTARVEAESVSHSPAFKKDGKTIRASVVLMGSAVSWIPSEEEVVVADEEVQAAPLTDGSGRTPLPAYKPPKRIAQDKPKTTKKKGKKDGRASNAT